MLSEIAMAFIAEEPRDFTRNKKTTRVYYLCFILYSMNDFAHGYQGGNEQRVLWSCVITRRAIAWAS
jgi:hypothetical protein